MIINSSEYNPLTVIFKYDLKEINSDVLNVVQYELFKGGVVAETAEEFTQVLQLLRETEKEFYGKQQA